VPDSRPGTYRVLDELAEAGDGDSEIARIVASAQAGDDLAFAELYVRLFDRVFRYLHLALKNADDAQEAAQDAFLTVFRMLDRYDPGRGPFEPWLFSVIRNLANDRLRRMRRARAIEEADRLRAPPTSVAERAASLLERLDPESGARAMVDSLPEAQRRALVLRFVFDMGAADIADVLGSTPDAVRHLQHRGLRALAARIDGVE
jgi:RNA polymerase sigma-70 factor (ECF subfamily)